MKENCFIFTNVLISLFVLELHCLEPEFLTSPTNITIPAARDVTLHCSINNLGKYKVAWIRSDNVSALLSIEEHVITRNPRITVSHENRHTWFLHIREVRETDAGRYLCQINTASTKTKHIYLNIVVPPNIIDEASSEDVTVREGANVTLRCRAIGLPVPSIYWQREAGKNISINHTFTAQRFEGETLTLLNVNRFSTGNYLCIASNGVPPSVSKRIQLKVNFPPILSVPKRSIGVYPGDSVALKCCVESYPPSLNFWIKYNGEIIHKNPKFFLEEKLGDTEYNVCMKLSISKVDKSDFMLYKCVAKNPSGEAEGSIQLYNILEATTYRAPLAYWNSYAFSQDTNVKDSNTESKGLLNANSGSFKYSFFLFIQCLAITAVSK